MPERYHKSRAGGRKRPEATAMDRNSIGQGLLGRRASKYLKVLSKDD